MTPPLDITKPVPGAVISEDICRKLLDIAEQFKPDYHVAVTCRDAAYLINQLRMDLTTTEIDAEAFARHANEADADADTDRAKIISYLKNLRTPVEMDWTFYDAAQAIERGDYLHHEYQDGEGL